jgi:hypothetical protein
MDNISTTHIIWLIGIAWIFIVILATMLDNSRNQIKDLRQQMEFLEEKLAALERLFICR